MSAQYEIWKDRKGDRLPHEFLLQKLQTEYGATNVQELPTCEEFKAQFGPEPIVYWEPSSLISPHNPQNEEDRCFPQGAEIHYNGLPKLTKLAPPPKRSTINSAAASSSSSGAAPSTGASDWKPWPGLGEIPAEIKNGSFRSVLILGPSGSGKTSLLKELVKEKFPELAEKPLIPKGEWKESVSIVDSFPSHKSASSNLGRIGLSSVPTWCKPYSCLSRGDQYRASVALELALREPNTPVIFDEWTSVLDRGMAMSISIAMSKVIKTSADNNKDEGPWIFAACHDDIASLLQPEWIVRCIAGQKPTIWKNESPAPPLMRSRFLSNLAPVGEGPQKFVAGFSFPDPKTTFLGCHKFMLNPINHLDDKRPRYKMSLSTEATSDPLVFYHNEEDGDDVLKCDKNDEQGPPCGESIELRYQSNGDRYFLTIDGVEHDLVRSNQPSSSSNIFRRVDTPVDYVRYDILNKELLERSGWFLPEGYRAKTFRGLQFLEMEETRPTFRMKPECEERKPQQEHIGVFVPVSAALGEATEVMDHAFLGTSVFELPHLPKDLGDFSVGAIVGTSGSGKSSQAKIRFDFYDIVWDEGQSCLDHLVGEAQTFLDNSAAEKLAQKLLDAVRLDHSVYVRTHSTFSGGEGHRAEIARVLLRSIKLKSTGEMSKAAVLEEFTSLLDRPTAINVALGVQAIVAEYQLKVVVLSCHDDFIGEDRLHPDWVLQCPSRRFFTFNPDRKNQVDGVDSLVDPVVQADPMPPRTPAKSKPAPEKKVATPGAGLKTNMPLEEYKKHVSKQKTIMLEVRRCTPIEWAFFREHHYKDHRMSSAPTCFVGCLDGKPIVFSAWICEAFNYITKNYARYDMAVIENDQENIEKFKPWKKLKLPQSWGPRLIYREHRTVVLPEYQGLGIGKLMCNTVCHGLWKADTMASSVTVHHHYGGYRDRSPYWRALPTNGKVKGPLGSTVRQFSHVYIGPLQEDGTDDAKILETLDEQMSIQPVGGIKSTLRSDNHRGAGLQIAGAGDASDELLPTAIGKFRKEIAAKRRAEAAAAGALKKKQKAEEKAAALVALKRERELKRKRKRQEEEDLEMESSEQEEDDDDDDEDHDNLDRGSTSASSKWRPKKAKVTKKAKGAALAVAPAKPKFPVVQGNPWGDVVDFLAVGARVPVAERRERTVVQTKWRAQYFIQRGPVGVESDSGSESEEEEDDAPNALALVPVAPEEVSCKKCQNEAMGKYNNIAHDVTCPKSRKYVKPDSEEEDESEEEEEVQGDPSCRKCQKEAMGNFSHTAHDVTCPRSKKYVKPDTEEGDESEEAEVDMEGMEVDHEEEDENEDDSDVKVVRGIIDPYHPAYCWACDPKHKTSGGHSIHCPCCRKARFQELPKAQMDEYKAGTFKPHCPLCDPANEKKSIAHVRSCSKSLHYVTKEEAAQEVKDAKAAASKQRASTSASASASASSKNSNPKGKRLSGSKSAAAAIKDKPSSPSEAMAIVPVVESCRRCAGINAPHNPECYFSAKNRAIRREQEKEQEEAKRKLEQERLEEKQRKEEERLEQKRLKEQERLEEKRRKEEERLEEKRRKEEERKEREREAAERKRQEREEAKQRAQAEKERLEHEKNLREEELLRIKLANKQQEELDKAEHEKNLKEEEELRRKNEKAHEKWRKEQEAKKQRESSSSAGASPPVKAGTSTSLSTTKKDSAGQAVGNVPEECATSASLGTSTSESVPRDVAARKAAGADAK